MTDVALPVLDAQQLRQLAQAQAHAPCRRCAALKAPGWEALSATFEQSALRKVATLRRSDVEDPTLAEYHPAGSNAWSADAPVAPAYFPYNRCDVWECVQCGRPFLRYVEYGGYYIEERVRELHAENVAVAPEPPGALA
ncbi:hypothetical protein [Ramlibacter sp.]|uniref:hypothetical protein n=1 Tax=Ramlibacter sp. TaxID=1917967 RepID=UPI00262F2F6D|nr:hypothetical protein [Ramlibacter sp.]MDB5957946.1 hypothetical protein [Ramlibacter sp.]